MATHQEQSAALTIRVDGELVQSIRSSDLTTRRSLFSLLPTEHQREGTWHSIIASGASRNLKIAHSQYPDASIELYLDEGTLAIGLFLPIPADAKPHVRRKLEQPHLSLRNISEVDLRSKAPNAPTPVASATLQLLHDKKPIAELTAETFSVLTPGMSFVERRNPERRPKEQYLLTDVLELNASRKTLKSVTLHSETRSIEIDAAALAAKDQRHLLKRNRRGIWLYRSYKEKSPGVQEELRGIVRLETSSVTTP